MWSARAESHDWWAKEIEPYIISARTLLNPHLMLLTCYVWKGQKGDNQFNNG